VRAGVVLAVALAAGLGLVAILAATAKREPAERTTSSAELRIAVMNEWRGHIFPCQCKARDLGDVAAQIGELSRLRADGLIAAVLYVGNVLGQNPEDEDEGTLSRRTASLRRELCFAAISAASPAAIVPGASDWREPLATRRLCESHRVVCSNARFEGPAHEIVLPVGGASARVRGFVLGAGDDGRFSDPESAIAAAVAADSAAGGARPLELVALCVDEDTSEDEVLRCVRAAGHGVVIVLAGKIEEDVARAADRETAGQGSLLVRGEVLGQEWSLLRAQARADAPRALDTVRITDRSPRDAGLAAALDAYNETVRHLVDDLRSRAAKKASDYHGEAGCAQCHPTIAKQWASTPHARAYHTLVAAERQTDPHCLACHTTGFGVEGGFVDADLTSDLTGVQCESCHGAGGTHPAARTPTAPRTTCRKCHDEMNSPHFRMEEYLARVACREDDRHATSPR
jgi:hypothetical protein